MSVGQKKSYEVRWDSDGTDMDLVARWDRGTVGRYRKLLTQLGKYGCLIRSRCTVETKDPAEALIVLTLEY